MRAPASRSTLQSSFVERGDGPATALMISGHPWRRWRPPSARDRRLRLRRPAAGQRISGGCWQASAPASSWRHVGKVRRLACEARCFIRRYLCGALLLLRFQEVEGGSVRSGLEQLVLERGHVSSLLCLVSSDSRVGGCRGVGRARGPPFGFRRRGAVTCPVRGSALTVPSTPFSTQPAGWCCPH